MVVMRFDSIGFGLNLFLDCEELIIEDVINLDSLEALKEVWKRSLGITMILLVR